MGEGSNHWSRGENPRDFRGAALLALKVKEDDGRGVLEKARSRFSLLWEIR